MVILICGYEQSTVVNLLCKVYPPLYLARGHAVTVTALLAYPGDKWGPAPSSVYYSLPTEAHTLCI